MTKTVLVWIVLAAAVLLSEGTRGFAATEYAPTGEPVVVAPGGLATKEQAELERQHRFVFRGKENILTPYVESDDKYAEGDYPERENEEERFYRYFGVAADLYKNGRLEEAIEILRYIVESKPDDAYVRNYLQRVEEENKAGQAEWSQASKNAVRRLKEKKIKALIEDGIDYYKRRHFDTALLKFHDALAIDPQNGTAKDYIAKLEGYYKREIKIRELVASGAADSGPLPEKDLLKEKDKMEQAAEKMLDEKEADFILVKKRIDGLLDRAELEMTVEEMVAAKKAEERATDIYEIGPGDVVSVSVRDHPELSGKTVVRLNGNIVLPLVNDIVNIKDKSIEEATEAIKEIMTRYVNEPFVTLNIEEYKSRVFYVIDEIGCTPYPIARANLTLRDALFVADWGDYRALGRVMVIKPDKIRPIVRKVDAYDIMYRGNLAGNIRIENGDVIYVPLTVAAKITKTISDTLKPVMAVRGARDEWMNQKGDIKSYKALPRITEKAQTTVWDNETFPSTQIQVVK